MQFLNLCWAVWILLGGDKLGIDVSRKEIKYVLGRCPAEDIQRKLALLLPVDKNSARGGYMVRSLYFDTIYDRDYYDKVEGLERRQKIRLRIYSPGDSTAKLELKEKIGNNQRKRSEPVAREDVPLMINRRYGELRDKYKSPFLQAVFYRMETEYYMPKTIVEYTRLAFMNQTNEIRITIDSSLKATEASFDLFSGQLSLSPILHPVVLEVKYTRFLLSYIKTALDMVDKTPVSVSKYCLGRRISIC